MKVTYNWLRDFIEIKLTPEALAQKLTMAGLEVTSLEAKDGDFVFEIEITSNRPDWLSVMGVAREVAALTNKKLKSPQAAGYRLQAKSLPHEACSVQPIVIKIEDKKDCPLYTAKIIQGVKVGPSPAWLKKRLELVGVRSVNNIVDITNYVLFELGEPLHAFDLDTLAADAIIVRRAKSTEKIITIDGEERTLGGDVLVIADSAKPVAIAGVMGAKATEVKENTRNILLEAAVFNPIAVRRGRQKLGLSSEAAYRFERGIDSAMVEIASRRTVELIRDIGGGEQVVSKRAGTSRLGNRGIDLDADFVAKILGKKIPAPRIKKILTGLGFKVSAKAKTGFKVKAPSYRQDVSAGIDLVEELARVSGYENIPITLPHIALQNQGKATESFIPRLKNILVGLGLNEVITYSLVDQELLKGFWDSDTNLIKIANPLSKEQEILRPQLMPSLTKCVAYNLRQQQPYVNIFEIAKVYFKKDTQIREEYVLGIALCGTESHWFGPRQGYVQDETGLLHLKGVLTAFLKRLGINEKDCRFIPRANDYYVDVLVKGTNVGFLRRLSKESLERFEIKYKEVFAAEIALESRLLALVDVEKKFRPGLVARYPGVTRDLTLELKSEIPLEDIYATISALNESLLQETGFKAFYEGKNVAAGHKRITISLRYSSPERTLTDEEIVPAHNKIVRLLQEKFQAKPC